MQNSAVIRLVDGALCWYPPGAGDQPQSLADEAAKSQLQLLISERRGQLYFAAPGADVRLLQREINSEEKKHLATALPYLLEEQLANDISHLHFATQIQSELSLAVAVVDVAAMQDWQQRLADFGDIKLWVPEPLLLPWRSGECCVVLSEGWAIVRYGAYQGFSVERDMLATLLESLEVTDDELRDCIIYGNSESEDLALLPTTLQEKAQWRRGGFGAALMLSEATQPVLNLRQGGFAQRLPLGRWWRQWRTVAAVFTAALCLQLLATWAEYSQLKSDNLALRGAIESSYRQAYPRGAMVDPEKQLQRQLDALRGTAQSSGFVAMMSAVGAVLAAQPGTEISSINYNDKGGEMRLNISAKNFEVVEAIRSEINRAKLQAVMESSSAQGDSVRARIRVGPK